MSAIGYGEDAGFHPMSSWNNPEPEVVLAVDSRGRIVGRQRIFRPDVMLSVAPMVTGCSQ